VIGTYPDFGLDGMNVVGRRIASGVKEEVDVDRREEEREEDEECLDSRLEEDVIFTGNGQGGVFPVREERIVGKGELLPVNRFEWRHLCIPLVESE